MLASLLTVGYFGTEMGKSRHLQTDRPTLGSFRILSIPICHGTLQAMPGDGTLTDPLRRGAFRLRLNQGVVLCHVLRLSRFTLMVLSKPLRCAGDVRLARMVSEGARLQLDGVSPSDRRIATTQKQRAGRKQCPRNPRNMADDCDCEGVRFAARAGIWSLSEA